MQGSSTIVLLQQLHEVHPKIAKGKVFNANLNFSNKLKNGQMCFFMAIAHFKNGQSFRIWPWNGKPGNPLWGCMQSLHQSDMTPARCIFMFVFRTHPCIVLKSKPMLLNLYAARDFHVCRHCRPRLLETIALSPKIKFNMCYFTAASGSGKACSSRDRIAQLIP